MMQIVMHILIRTASLLVLGVLTVNYETFSAEHTPIDVDTWFFIVSVAIIFIWNSGTAELRKKKIHIATRVFGGVALLAMLIIYRSVNQQGEVGWLTTSWWGILGIIGWSYLSCSLVYLALRKNPYVLFGVVGLMVTVYIGMRQGVLDSLWMINRFISVGILFGSQSALVLTGAIIGKTLKDPERSFKQNLIFFTLTGLGLLFAGVMLRPLHGASKIDGTESYYLLSGGWGTLVFTLIYILSRFSWFEKGTRLLIPAGRNPLLAYFAIPVVLGLLFIVKINGIHIFLPFWERGGVLCYLNVTLVAFVTLFVVNMLTRAKVILKM